MRQFIVVGLGKFGMEVALALASNGMQVLAIDKDPRKTEAIADKVTYAVRADATDQKELAALGLSGADAAIVSLGNKIEDSVLATMILKEFGIPEVIVKGISKEHGKILKLVGATEVVFPEEDMARKIAQKIMHPNIIEHIPLLPNYSIVEIIAPKTFQGKTLLELNLRREYGVEVLMIRRGTNVRMVPAATMEKIQEGDILLMLGKNEDLEKIRQME